MCARCSSLEEAIKSTSESEAKLVRDLDNCERDLRNWRARYTRLENEIERERGTTAEGQKVEEVIEHWRTATGHLDAKVSTVGKRAEYVRKAFRLKFSVEECKAICDVAGSYPFVDPKRSKHPSGRCQTGEILRDDIPTLFKDEVTMGRLLDLAKSAPGAQPEDENFSTAERWRRLNYPMARVMAALWEIEAELLNPMPDVWETHCPVHFGPALVAIRNEAGIMSIECTRGCEFWRLLAALDLEPDALFENSEHDPDRQTARDAREVPEHLQQAAGILVSRLSGVAGSNGRSV